MDGRYEEVFSNLEERTEMTGASRSWLFIESCWKLEMQQVGTAFIQWRLPNMYLSSPHKKKIHAVPADSRPSNQHALQIYWKPPNCLILCQTHIQKLTMLPCIFHSALQKCLFPFLSGYFQFSNTFISLALSFPSFCEHYEYDYADRSAWRFAKAHIIRLF